MDFRGSKNMPFEAVCQLLEQLSANKAKRRKDLLEKFFNLYGQGDYFAVYRLLLPEVFSLRVCFLFLPFFFLPPLFSSKTRSAARTL